MVFPKLKNLTNGDILGGGGAVPYPQSNLTRSVEQKNLHSAIFFLTWRFEPCFYIAPGKAIVAWELWVSAMCSQPQLFCLSTAAGPVSLLVE